jgi:DNA-directed RNA polymerase specialized sigma24 family protein
MAEHNTSRYTDFDALAARHQGLIRSLCWWYAGGKADAVADLIQDVMLSLWHYRHTLRADASAAQERQWVRLHCRSVFEHQQRRPQVDTVPMEEALHVAAEDTSARDAIDRLTDGLNAQEHHVLELVLDGYSDGEIDNLLRLVPGEAALLHNAVIEKMKQKAGEVKN